MSNYHKFPINVNWSLLISLLRRSFTHGDGGLPQASGIAARVLTDGVRNGVHSYTNGVILLNLALDRLDRVDYLRCDLDLNPSGGPLGAHPPTLMASDSTSPLSL